MLLLARKAGQSVVITAAFPLSTPSFGGAWLNKKAIRVSRERRLDRALLATGFAYDIGTARRNNLGLFARMARILFRIPSIQERLLFGKAYYI